MSFLSLRPKNSFTLTIWEVTSNCVTELITHFYISTIVSYMSLDAICQLGLISICIFVHIFISGWVLPAVTGDQAAVAYPQWHRQWHPGASRAGPECVHHPFPPSGFFFFINKLNSITHYAEASESTRSEFNSAAGKCPKTWLRALDRCDLSKQIRKSAAQTRKMTTEVFPEAKPPELVNCVS